MGVKLAGVVNDGLVHPEDMKNGQFGEVTYDPNNDWTGSIVYKGFGKLHRLNNGTHWGLISDIKFRVRILQPGETIEITED